LEALVKRRSDVTLRRVDIGSWDSPVARQFGVKRLPDLLLYDSDGRMVERGTEAVLARLR